ncbi:RDD family protein [Streptomyces sp. NBC_00287]|uniref:RDD family protein n=1 Tax=Streptomyces sp. NBC_00287 TaxID=2975702 RepID=UPI002E2E1488|nr:RDD family protein [Streptomyces sp. NBC_00287]
MSAPTPAPGDDRPREGYYPDPSIPGYVRYWNGAAWVPGTSRPAPTDGEPLAPPPGTTPAPVEETGPHFFDEDPADEPAPAQGQSQHGSRPEPATAWGADRSHQSGFGGDQDRRVSWGGVPDPRTPAPADGTTPSTDGTTTIPPAEGAASGRAGAAASGTAASAASGRAEGAAYGPAEGAASGNTFVFRRPTPGPAAQGTPDSGASAAGRTRDSGAPAADEGTMTFRALSPRTGRQDGAPGAQQGRTADAASGQGAAGAGGTGAAGFGPPTGAGGADAGGFGAAFPAAGGTASPAPQGRGFGAGKAAAERAAAAQGQQAQVAAPTALSGPQASPTVPQQSGPQSAAQPGAQPQGAAAPVTTGPGGGQPSWAQQVHRLAGAPGEDQPVAPWKPPVEDVFQAAARRQASARPASLGRRLAARLVDTVVLSGVTAVAAVPLGIKAMDHVDEKIDAAKLSGETVTVWLLDGTTSAYLGIVLAVLLLFGALYEALPTAKWGRTLGKKLLGIEVRDIEAHEPPSFGGALRRWLVYSVPGLLVIGVVGVLWCLFDKPWRQCWHDKAAGTFVAG